MRKQSGGFKNYSKTIGGQQHFERKVEGKGNKIKTMFTSRIIFKSSRLDVTPPTLFRWQGYRNRFQVPTCLEQYPGRNGEEGFFLRTSLQLVFSSHQPYFENIKYLPLLTKYVL